MTAFDTFHPLPLTSLAGVGGALLGLVTSDDLQSRSFAELEAALVA